MTNCAVFPSFCRCHPCCIAVRHCPIRRCSVRLGSAPARESHVRKRHRKQDVVTTDDEQPMDGLSSGFSGRGGGGDTDEKMGDSNSSGSSWESASNIDGDGESGAGTESDACGSSRGPTREPRVVALHYALLGGLGSTGAGGVFRVRLAWRSPIMDAVCF